MSRPSNFLPLILAPFLALLAGADAGYAEIPKDQPGPTRPLTEDLRNIDPYLLKRMKEEDYGKLSPEDPLLRYAYADMLQLSDRDLGAYAPGRFLITEDEQAPILADLRHRGEAGSAILLKMLEENPETGYEIDLLCKVDQIGTFRLEPYIEYSRRMLRDRIQTMNSAAAGSAAGLLARCGSQEDAELMRWVLKQRPYVTTDVSIKLGTLESRLARLKLVEERERKRAGERLRNGRGGMPDGVDPTTSSPPGHASRARTWSIGLLGTVVIAGLLWLKFRRKPSPNTPED